MEENQRETEQRHQMYSTTIPRGIYVSASTYVHLLAWDFHPETSPPGIQLVNDTDLFTAAVITGDSARRTEGGGRNRPVGLCREQKALLPGLRGDGDEHEAASCCLSHSILKGSGATCVAVCRVEGKDRGNGAPKK